MAPSDSCFDRAVRLRLFCKGLVFGGLMCAFAVCVAMAAYVEVGDVLGRRHSVAINLMWHLETGTITIPEYFRYFPWHPSGRFVLLFLVVSIVCRLLVRPRKPLAMPVKGDGHDGPAVAMFGTPRAPRPSVWSTTCYLIGLLWIGVFAASNTIGDCNVCATMTGGANPSLLNVPQETWWVYDGAAGLVLAFGTVGIARLYNWWRPLHRSPEPLVASIEILTVTIAAICFLALVGFLPGRI